MKKIDHDRLAELYNALVDEISSISCGSCRFDELQSLRCDLGARLNDNDNTLGKDGDEECAECTERFEAMEKAEEKAEADEED